MKKILFILISVFSLTMVAQTGTKRIAILETVDKEGNVNLGTKVLLRQSLTYAITKTPGYEGYNRVNMQEIMDEHKFQRTGYVNDAQIKKIGEMTGATYVLIAEAVNYDYTRVLVLANLVNIESGQIVNSSTPEVADTDPEGMQKACIKIARMLLNVSGSSSPSSYGGSYSSSYSAGRDFTESAWGINMQMIWVEGGSFLMGCTSEQGNDCYDDEKNVRRVTLDGFYIGMLEVTQSQWEKVVGTNPSYFKKGGDFPVENVSWDDAMEFCRLLSNKTGRTYTLPTEAQWEYAARGGSRNEGTKYAGSNMLDAVGWYDGNSGSSTHRCGTKRGNALGIYDMSGNVWEWCKDWYSSSYLSYDTNNPVGPSSGSNRVLRGGSWIFSARGCRVARRSDASPSIRSNYLGFRVVCLP